MQKFKDIFAFVLGTGLMNFCLYPVQQILIFIINKKPLYCKLALGTKKKMAQLLPQNRKKTKNLVLYSLLLLKEENYVHCFAVHMHTKILSLAPA